MSPRLPFLALLVGMTVVGVRSASGDVTSEDHAGADEGDGRGRSRSAATEPARTWYCGAGTAGGPADHTVVVSNPLDEAASGQVTVFSDRRPGRPYRVTVPAEGDVRVEVAEVAEAAEVADAVERTGRRSSEGDDRETFVAALVETDRPVVVEHEVETDDGQAAGPCASRGAPEWHFAWGATTRDARDLLVLFNPFPSDVVVDAVFSTPGGRREPVRWQGLIVPGREVMAVDVGDDVTRRSQVAATVRAREGSVIAERLTVFDGSLDLQGARLTLGRPEPTMTATFPGGDLGEDGRELVALYNPDEERTAEVDVLVRPDDPAVPEPAPFGLVVRPGTFEILDYSEESRVDLGEAHVTHVSSTNGVPVVAEQVLIADDGSLSSRSARTSATCRRCPS